MRSLLTSPARALPLGLIVALSACRASTQSDDALSPPESPPAPALDAASTDLRPIGNSGVSGRVTFVNHGRATEVQYALDGLAPGDHGLGLHETGDCGADAAGTPGMAAGRLVPPQPRLFDEVAAPRVGRRAGDFGTVTADARGHASGVFADSLLAFDVFGRAVIVHEKAGTPETAPSGARVACGVIELRREGGHH